MYHSIFLLVFTSLFSIAVHSGTGNLEIETANKPYKSSVLTNPIIQEDLAKIDQNARANQFGVYVFSVLIAKLLAVEPNAIVQDFKNNPLRQALDIYLPKLDNIQNIEYIQKAISNNSFFIDKTSNDSTVVNYPEFFTQMQEGNEKLQHIIESQKGKNIMNFPELCNFLGGENYIYPLKMLKIDTHSLSYPFLPLEKLLFTIAIATEFGLTSPNALNDLMEVLNVKSTSDDKQEDSYR